MVQSPTGRRNDVHCEHISVTASVAVELQLQEDAFIFWHHKQGKIWVEPHQQAIPPHLAQAHTMAAQGPGARYNAEVEGQLRSLFVIVPTRVVGAALGHEGALSYDDERFTRIAFRDERLSLLMQAISADLDAAEPAGPLFRDCAGQALARGFISLSLGAPLQQRKTHDGAMPAHLVQRVRDLIEARLAEKLSLDELAASVGLSTSHFCVAFKRSTGLPPHRYLLVRRTQRARELLRQRDLPLAEIATRLGFCDQSQLTKVFRRFVGVTPAHYRRELNG
jgi:AraC family transcriptional regulator